MSVPLTLLGLLEREPSHGYDLKRDYDTYFGRGKPLCYGQVYATLSRLARDGQAIAGAAEHGEGPDHKRYTITEAGIAACADREVIVRDGRTTALTGVAPAPRTVQ
jgi:DNA-binding PadR family transcriptional regulator